MATDKLFTVAGISKLNGEYKVRFANDSMRVKVLAKHDHTDIRLVELDRPMTKLEAAASIATMEDFADATAQATITEYISENTPKAKVSKPVAKATKTPVAKTTKVTAKVTEDEDAPF
jgi:ABC-type Zn uptake system ZnuABC Zn-binding protein ZnuA